MKKELIKATDIIKHLSNKDVRERVSLYLSKSVYSEFRKACEKEEVRPSQVMDELMKIFIESLKNKE